MLSNVNWGQG